MPAREIRLAIDDRDICGIRCTERQAVFFSLDRDFTFHTTAHAAEREQPGVIHTREEGLLVKLGASCGSCRTLHSLENWITWGDLNRSAK